jgi:hypothetical protein
MESMSDYKIFNIYYRLSYKQQKIDEKLHTQIGQTVWAFFRKLKSLTGEQPFLIITRKHFLNAMSNMFCARTFSRSMAKLEALGFITRTKTFKRDACMRIKSSSVKYEINWGNVWRFLDKAVGTFCHLPSVAYNTYVLSINVTKSALNFSKTDSKKKTANATMEKAKSVKKPVALNIDKPISDKWVKSAIDAGLSNVQIEEMYQKFKYHYAKSRSVLRTTKEWTYTWGHWIKKKISWNKGEKTLSKPSVTYRHPPVLSTLSTVNDELNRIVPRTVFKGFQYDSSILAEEYKILDQIAKSVTFRGCIEPEYLPIKRIDTGRFVYEIAFPYHFVCKGIVINGQANEMTDADTFRGANRDVLSYFKIKIVDQ